MNVDGSGQRRLTYGESEEYIYKWAYYPDWSPDGQRIVFSSGQFQSSSIFIMNADGSERQRIGAGTEPTWAPDGRAIAFIGREYYCIRDCTANGLWIVDLDNLGNEIRVAPYLEPSHGTQHFQNPNWGPLLSK